MTPGTSPYTFPTERLRMTTKTIAPLATLALAGLIALLIAAPAQARSCGNAAPYLRSVQVEQAKLRAGQSSSTLGLATSDAMHSTRR